ncbi:MAG: restriction endonuclease [Blastocatellia bacterium]
MRFIVFTLLLLIPVLILVVPLLLRLFLTLRTKDENKIPPREKYEDIDGITRGIIQTEPSETILVVEDNRDSRNILTKLLQMSGYEAISAVDGVDALEYISRQKPDLVITDINMPRMDGIELIKRLRRDRKTADIPVLAVTAFGSIVAREAIEAGADASAEKPFDSDKFLLTARSIIARSSRTPTQQDKGPEPDLIVPVKKSIALVNERLAHHFQNDPEALRRIDPFIFERVVAELFEDEGYEVVVTQPRADGGKDIYVYKKDPVTNLMLLVECKRYTPPNKVSVETTRQLYGVVQQERANAGIIVTTSYFTKPAKDFANGVPYQLFLIDFDYLSQWLNKKK